MRAGVDNATDFALQRYVRTMLVAGGVAAVVYLLVLGDPLRSHLFSSFYDVQARAFFGGDLHVEAGTLGIEAFVVDAKQFIYFPPGPALLRMPLLAITDSFDGQLTGVSMLIAWIVTAVLVSLLVWRVRRLFRGSAPLGRMEAGAYGLFLVAVMVGSVMLFLGSIPWVYHEAYAWAIAMAVGALYSLLGLIEQPGRGRVVATGLFTLGAILSRTPTGWACAAAVLAAAVWFLSGRRGDEARRLWWAVALAGLTPLVIAGAVNWAKFGHPILFPLEDQVFTGLSQQRRDALAANGGDLVSPDILFSTLVNYFRPDGIRFTSIFPFITLPPEAARSYGGGVLDQTYRTGSVVSFMPVLFGLSLWGMITSFRPGGRPGAEVTRLPVLGALAIPAAAMFYGYIAHRYTSEFVPLLIVGGAIGLVDVARRLEGRERRLRAGMLAALALLVAFSVTANLAVSSHAHVLAHSGGRLRAYVWVQERISGWTGDPLAEFVEVSETLPAGGRADELHVVGDCDALFVASGAEVDPWVPVEIRDLAVRVGVDSPGEVGGDEVRGRTRVATLSGHDQAEIALERRGDRLRLVLVDGTEATDDWFEEGDVDAASEWEEVEVGDEFVLSVNAAFDGAFVAGLTPSRLLFVSKWDFDEDFSAFPNVLSLELDPDGAADLGLDVEAVETDPLEQCERLLDLHDERAAPG